MDPFLNLSQLPWIDELYLEYQKNPDSVEPSWRAYFSGLDAGRELFQKAVSDEKDRFRRFGHLDANINPLAPLKEVGEDPLKKIYCGTIGFEYMDLGDSEIKDWIQRQVEGEKGRSLSDEEKLLTLETLNRAEGLETFLHTKYAGQTRFSLEGAETLIPILAELVEEGSQLGLEEVVIGMAHRGRLNVLANLMEKPYEALFQEFEDIDLAPGGDVKYHLGFTSDRKTRRGGSVKISMPPNPSHLESIDPVVLGIVRSKQQEKGVQSVCPFLIHGDASLAGQGVIYESLQFARLPGYATGGTIHIVVNNQIGFTTLPQEGRSTLYCTDIAKAFDCPVFHVNAEDPEACTFVARLAIEIRQKFQRDVFIDLIGYRKYGHNEGDEPSFTQPLHYQIIRSKKSIRDLYFDSMSEEGRKRADKLDADFRARLHSAYEQAKKASIPFQEEGKKSSGVKMARVTNGELISLTDACSAVPEGFFLHPKLEKWLEARRESLSSQIDWATAEFLSFATILSLGLPIRFTGQDVRRGTFNQRHAVFVDQNTGESYIPLSHLKGTFEIVNSPLSEFASVAFEYGYSCEQARGLTLWEAQYGDFSNGAQIVIDQYISAGEEKWKLLSPLTLLLPHGYEGKGPEHSSARMERFLQLCAKGNMHIANPSTPAQYFHLLRRQVTMRKPLIVFTPKSLLRAPACTSLISAFTEAEFEEVLDDPTFLKAPKKLFFTSGKIFYDLLTRKKESDILIRIEELYPFPTAKVEKILAKYPTVSQFFWIQEEPENMGAWESVRPHLAALLPTLSYIGRERSASTAVGSYRKHKEELEAILNKAFS